MTLTADASRGFGQRRLRGLCAGFDPRRAAARVIPIDTLSALVLDLDKGADIDALEDAIGARGLFALVHSTWSHGMTKTEINVEAYTKATGCTVFEIQWVYSYLRRPNVIPAAFGQPYYSASLSSATAK